MNKNILIGVVILIIAGAVILGFNKKTINTNNSNVNQAVPSPSVNEQKTLTENITVTTTGFVPQALVVKAGTKVVWTNKSGNTVTVNSAGHPTHLLYPPLNLGEFSDGASVSLIFDKPGTYSYHNHLNPSQTGNIIVQ